MKRFARPPIVLLGIAIAWLAALAFSTLAARVLYADGAYYVLLNLVTPFRFNDYDAQRTFASFLTQAPVLFGQKMGIDSVSAYAALYAIGCFALPAAAMLVSLFLARNRPLLFAANAFGTVVFGFGANFINTESNLLTGFAWLCATLLALESRPRALTALGLPLLAFAMLRMYEGMLLVGPVLAWWAYEASTRTRDDVLRVSLFVSSLLFALGAVIGFGGFVSPRDPGNASSFLRHAVLYLRNPQALLLLSAAMGVVVALSPRGGLRWGALAASAIAGWMGFSGMATLRGYLGYEVYHQNRSFLALFLPVPIAGLYAAWRWRPEWLGETPASFPQFAAALWIPMAAAVATDVAGTVRWMQYMGEFCTVLAAPMTEKQRMDALYDGPFVTGWTWTHPTMSVLLRARGSDAMVPNRPTPWEPFPSVQAPRIPHRGACEASFVPWPRR